jgi:hypothetical protein
MLYFSKHSSVFFFPLWYPPLQNGKGFYIHQNSINFQSWTLLELDMYWFCFMQALILVKHVALGLTLNVNIT